MKQSLALITMVLALATGLHASDAFQLWKEAKGFWYDEKWEQAAEAYETLLKDHPDSQFRDKSRYFLAYCEVKLNNDDRAFEILSELIEDRSAQDDKNLLEDAKSLRLVIATDKAKRNPAMKSILVDSLKDPMRSIRFQAAHRLAGLKDATGIEVLFHVVENEKDSDLRDLATKDILLVGTDKDKKRLDDILRDMKNTSGDQAPKMLRFIIRDLKNNNETVKVNVPISLYPIILRGLTPEQRDLIEQNHIDLDQLARDLKNMPANTVIFELRNKDQEIKMFLD